jgi:protein-tyrosine phosphatase
VIKVHTIVEGALYQRGNCLNRTYEDKKALLFEYGIEHIVNCWHRADDDLIRLVGLEYYDHVPIPDSPRFINSVRTLESAAVRVAGFIEGGYSAMTQCHAGRNRSGLMSALIVRELMHCSGEEALEVVRARRRNALATPSMETYLMNLPAP